jgi:hypothetical protein
VVRVLPPGGRLVVSTPNHGVTRRLLLGLSRHAFERNFDPRSDHVRFFTAHSLRILLTVAGFDVRSIVAKHGVLLAEGTSGQDTATPTPSARHT